MNRWCWKPAVLLMLLSSHSYGQEVDQNSFQSWSFGFNLNEFQQDFGLGLQVASPYFGGKVNASVRLVYNFQYLQHLSASGMTTWTAYRNGQLGIKFGAPIINNLFRYYGEAGGILIFPNEEFSSQSTEPGLYGLFGFEFLLGEMKGASRGYFIELGAMGTGARADKVPSEPIYSNGFMISVGLRFYHRRKS